jgi:KRAB domain-containing zinc finger protein
MCPVCKVPTAELTENYPRHFRVEHRGLKFQRSVLRFPHTCPVCPYETQQTHLFKKHLFVHGLVTKEETYRYECKQCQEKFGSRSTLQTHEHKAHGAPKCAKCDVCGKEFTNNGSLSVHKMEHKEGKRICEHCGKEFPYGYHYNNHLVKCRPRTSVLCSICGAVYLTRAGLKGHLATEHGEGNFAKKKFEETCGECGKVLKTKDFFLDHMYRQHGKELPGLKKFPCPDCDEVFFVKRYFKTHAMLHLDKMYTCSDCGYQTRYSQNLSKHAIKVHNKRLVKYRPLKQSCVPSEKEPVD